MNADNLIAVNERKDAEAVAQALGRQVTVATAKSDRDLERAFEMFVDQTSGRPSSQRTRVRYRRWSDDYGAIIPDVYRQSGIYVGRVLRGTKPSEFAALQG